MRENADAARTGGSPTEPMTSYVTDEMMGKAVSGDRDFSALAAVMDRAEKGGDITVALIGGSITMGTVSKGASDEGRDPVPYAEIFRRWWERAFPRARVRFVNAGIGGTDSYLGTHRVGRDVLDRRPDVVLTEFSVNDEDTEFFRVSYNSLVRHILEAPSRPAAMLLFMGQTNRTTARRIHARVGEAYRLPAVSCTDVFNAMMDGGVFTAEQLSGDEVHPSALGHAVTGELLWRFLNRVREEAPRLRNAPDRDGTEREEDKYPHARVMGAADIVPEGSAGFSRGTGSEFYPDGWKGEGDGAEISFRLAFRTLGILFLKTVDGTSGKAEVLLDGEKRADLDADFTGGWGNAVAAGEVFTGDAAGEHTLTVRLKEAGKKFELLGLLVSG